MAVNKQKILKQLSPKRIVIPIIIGVLVAIYLLYKEWNTQSISQFQFTLYTVLFLVSAIFMMLIRDIGYMVRLKILTNNDLKWTSVFNIILLWEFASAVTPSAIGGTSVATYFIHKEGLSVGRSAAIVLATSILDELYFVLMFPILLLIVGIPDLFMSTNTSLVYNQYFYFAVVAYSIKLLFVFFLIYGLFINPLLIKKILIIFFKFPFLRKWKNEAAKTGDDIILASQTLKHQKIRFWIKAFIATFFSWTARYWVVNFLILALLFGIPDSQIFLSFQEHILIFARQLVIWVMMLVMPTPGASGFVELIFSNYLGVFIPLGFVSLIIFIWRLITYYLYLFLGVIIIPRWIKNKV